MRRLLLVSNTRIGSRMAGPGMRYHALARELAGRFDVTLVVPEKPDVELDVARVVAAPELSYRRFMELARGSDAIVAQQLSSRAMRALAGGRAKVVYDLYDPLLVETLPLLAGRPDRRQRETMHRHASLQQLIALSTGDAFLCASERQRDLWLGLLTALGRADVDAYVADPTLRSLVDVVPFGIDEEPPQATRRALKGVVPGIRETDRVLLWGGGIWDWFDPLTVIRAVARVAETRDDVKLFFLGRTEPGAAGVAMTMPERAHELARRLGVEGSAVFFNDGWVAHDDRANYLLDADIGVSAHFDSVETRFAFRTRLLDYFWAGLPTLTTEGDVLAELVERRAVGHALPPGDVDGWVDSIQELVGDDVRRRTMAESLEALRGELGWPRLAARVAEIVEEPPRARGARPGAVGGLRRLRHGGVFVARGAAWRAADAMRPLRRPPVP